MAQRNQPYIPLYVQDFMTDEKLSECSAESTGVYIRLMCVMHKSEQYGTILLKQKDKQNESNITNFACKLLKQMPYSVDVIERSLSELLDEGVLTMDGDTLFQKRMVRDGKLSDARATAGRKGGIQTQNTSVYDSFASTFAKAKHQAKPQANTEYEVDIENVSESVREPVRESPCTKISRKRKSESSFDQFWNAYPKKVAKAAALKAWERIKVDEVLLRLMLKKIAEQITGDGWTRENGQFIPYPATWLNQERWKDEAPTIAPKPRAAPPGQKPHYNPFLDMLKEAGET